MYLYGASGHGKVIKEILESRNKVTDGFIDDNPNINEIAGLPVFHSADQADEIIISIGVNKTRKMVAEKLNCKIAKAAIHRTAIVSDTSVIREGTVVMGGAVINADAKIGKHCIINTGASIDHECLLDDYVHISPHATLCGNVIVGEGAWVGAGAIVIQGVKIGRWSMIGAGTVLTKDVPDGWLAVGNKCRLVKKINQDLL